MKAGRKREDVGAPPDLLPEYLIPDTPKRVSAKAADSPALLEWITWWNGLHTKGLVDSGVKADPPSKAIVAAWKRVQRDSELQEFLKDRDAIEDAIRKSEFLRASWFDLPRLLAGKNKRGDYVVQQVVEGKYSDFKAPRALANTGAGVVYSPERSYGDGF